jgi:PAS domain S-box-containing protein
MSPEAPSPDILLDFFENGGVALHIVDGDGTILHANQAELRLLGYQRAEYVGRNIAEFHVDQDVIAGILARLKAGDALRREEVRLRAADGSIRHIELTSSGHFENGRFVNTRCFSVDVTELVRAREGIRLKDEQLKGILDALPAAVYTTDREGTLTYFNRAAVELAGREPRLGVDKWCVTYQLRTVNGEPLAHEACPMAVALKENRPVRGVEALALRPDGSLIPFLPFPTPLHDQYGNLIGAVNMLVDISERKAAEANQRLLLRELNHRVKNNMNMLYGLFQTARREARSKETAEELSGIAARVAAMASAQHALYRESQPRAFESVGFVEAVCASIRQLLGSHVTLRVACEELALHNDLAIPLALIINELVTNAAKHGIADRESGEIRVSLVAKGPNLVLSVADDGPGFDPGSPGRRSSGLGLVAGLTRQIGGKFEVEPGTSRCTVRFHQKSLH